MSTAMRPNMANIEKLGQLAQGYFVSSALNAVTRLGIADILDANSMQVDELARVTSTNKDALCRVLRFLCSVGIFEESAPEKFANNETSHLMKANAEGSQKDMILFIANPLHFKAYTDMLPVLRDGKTAAHHVWGKGIFEVFADDKEDQLLFDNAMTAFSRNAIPGILEAYDFSGINKLVDVAGGHGALLTAILQKYPAMQGVLFDLDHVTPGAVESIKKQNLADRCEVAVGDFFKAVPEGDAILMKHIIHDWDDERALEILKNCHKALSKSASGKLLIAEMLLAEGNEPNFTKYMDIEMLMLPGGRERTEKQFAELFAKAGFKLNKVVRTKGPIVVLEAVLS